ncbi:MAG: DUF1297 domain-containing protein [Candidatus Micrarchaeota archaeon]|nr:DUF1297 domain-containing protein [Candidatus Micrarchaeota archaeon]MDE1848018.1 DUF1297 domain-containing protein [Candidatus Micrarchaeota archaeon]MDE1864605.1 DUF1297 domain-containing protein [Candidatus Micrarchaeota archaeon]
MIRRSQMQRTADKFSDPSVATLGSHSALEIARGAVDEQLRSVVVAKKGRELPYTKYYKTDGDLGCVDNTILIKEWRELAEKRVIGKLLEYGSIFIPHRSFQVYLGYDKINNHFTIPIFGNRKLLQAEERGASQAKVNQEFLLEVAGIPTPKKFNSPREIDRQVIVKASAAIGDKPFQRNFPIVGSADEYIAAYEKEVARARNKEEGKLISKSFKSAPIQEYLPGNTVNINYFYSILTGELEIMGTDTRIQFPWGEEMGHYAISPKESLIPMMYSMGMQMVEACKEYCKPGIIGPFALQSVAKENDKLLVYDASFRTPGSPDSKKSPSTEYRYGHEVSIGRRIAMEIKEALRKDRLKELVT